jgi:cardiolipin synthase
MVFVAISLLLQLGWMILLVLRFSQSSIWISAVTNVIAALLVLEIIYRSASNTAFRLPWIVLISVFPLVGLLLYSIMGHSGITRRKKQQFAEIGNQLRQRLQNPEAQIARIEQQNPVLASQMRYIWRDGQYPPSCQTETVFYGDTNQALDAMIEALSMAQSFILMEYHAIEDATAFRRIRTVLSQKAAQGVTVRVIYDDVGSMGFLSPHFIKSMQADGIACRMFNPMLPVLNAFMNNRDHRKITVIDGQVGFTGGYNLADEYFNITHPYGEWKDTGIRMTGDAVQNLTVQFLEMWNMIRKSDTDLDFFFPTPNPCPHGAGIVQPYGEAPLLPANLAENVYMNMIQSARTRIWFMTPYLILDDNMVQSLTLAAKRGVDVRILTPGIPDKKMVYRITRSYYPTLVSSGIRIYEFTPGFLHAKQCLCDDIAATVGTINLDYRSLYFHFENGVFFADCPAVQAVEADFIATMQRCQEVTAHYQKEPTGIRRLCHQILRLFAPLL